MIGAAHAPAAFTVPGAAAASLLCIWYWRRLGAAHVPVSRRRIRRGSVGLMIVGAWLGAAGLSLIDRQARPSAYVLVWMVLLLDACLVLLSAALDIANTARLGREDRRRRLIEDALAGGARRASGRRQTAW